MIVQRLNSAAMGYLVFCVLLTMLFTTARAQPAPGGPGAGKWNPEVFPISYWTGPPGEFVAPERFQQIADAGFTYAMPPEVQLTPELNKKFLDEAKAAGIKAFIRDNRMPHALGDGDAKKKDIAPWSPTMPIIPPWRATSSATSRAPARFRDSARSSPTCARRIRNIRRT